MSKMVEASSGLFMRERECGVAEYLIQYHNKTKTVGLPIGKREEGEDAVECFHREMYEELLLSPSDYQIESCNPFKQISTVFPGTFYMEHIFKCDVSKDVVVVNNEPKSHEWVEWLTMDEIKLLDMRLGNGLITAIALFRLL